MVRLVQIVYVPRFTNQPFLSFYFRSATGSWRNCSSTSRRSRASDRSRWVMDYQDFICKWCWLIYITFSDHILLGHSVRMWNVAGIERPVRSRFLWHADWRPQEINWPEEEENATGHFPLPSRRICMQRKGFSGVLEGNKELEPHAEILWHFSLGTADPW